MRNSTVQTRKRDSRGGLPWESGVVMDRKSAGRLCAKSGTAGRVGENQVPGLGGQAARARCQRRRPLEKSIELMNETPTKIRMAASSKKKITAVSPKDSGRGEADPLPKRGHLFSVLYA